MNGDPCQRSRWLEFSVDSLKRDSFIEALAPGASRVRLRVGKCRESLCSDSGQLIH